MCENILNSKRPSRKTGAFLFHQGLRQSANLDETTLRERSDSKGSPSPNLILHTTAKDKDLPSDTRVACHQGREASGSAWRIESCAKMLTESLDWKKK